MILKNLLRRKGRTILAVLGISIGVSAIIALGALADGLEGGYNAMLTGSKADLILSQPNSFDISFSSVDEEIGDELAAMSEVAQVSGMLQGFVQTESLPIFFVFGYPQDSFILTRFKIIDGLSLNDREVSKVRGKPLLLGNSAAEALNKQVGDSLRVTDTVYRVVGTYETGDGFEDSGAVLLLPEAQDLLGKPRQVSIFYIQLKDVDLHDRLERRVARRWPDLSLSTSDDYADKQLMGDMLKAYVWVIAGLAIVLGGIGMMNSQLMSVFERTREIGVLRAVGWSSKRVLFMILAESMIVGLAGGVLGIGLGWLMLYGLAEGANLFGVSVANIRPGLLGQAFVVVMTLGLFGGLYPAWRASRLQPVEALRYEGGSTGERSRRLPFGGMALQSLWQRTARTFLTLGAISITVGSIMALEGVVQGAASDLTNVAIGADVEIMIRQADIADTSLSALDERIGDKIAAMPEVESVSGMIMTAVLMPEEGTFFLLFGLAPNEFAIQKYRVVEGTTLTSNHQIMLGSVMAEALNKSPGETIDLGGTRFRIVGIYESGVGWEELGGIISLRDAQSYAGRPRKVTLYGVKLNDPAQARSTVEKINTQIPEAHATLTGEFAEQMPDMENVDQMMNGISFLAIFVGGVGVLNTMLMAVYERTREIGVMRALGWQRRRILAMIMNEALLLGILGGVLGIAVALGLVELLSYVPMVGGAVSPGWSLEVFARAMAVALFLGLLGGLYPAYRATRLQPVEAIRYE
ncbi:MAG: FtsX-like permease family protein [Anaerolineales bacterium]|nr:FtsX-like permease family protein [Anaerolineales bacterium]